MTRSTPPAKALQPVTTPSADEPPTGFYDLPLGNLLWHVRLTERAMQKAMREALLHTNVTKAQFGIMQVLERIQRASSATLARTLTVSPQAMVGVIGSLEVKGFIKRRTTSSESARILVAQLTPKGRAAFSAASDRFALLDTALQSAFTEAERQTLVDLLARMRAVLDQIDQSYFKSGTS